MSRGRTRRGRGRADRRLEANAAAPPLFRTTDHGPAVPLAAKDIGAGGDRWIDGFLAANRPLLRRLEVKAEISADRELQVRLRPGPRIGAIPLAHPVTRKIAAGLLVEPRFRWSALGSVFEGIGFDVEPSLGGAPLVPGSAREVPPWVLAGPVLRRLAALLKDRRRGFVDVRESRRSPRGRVDWREWATKALPRGRWTTFPCSYTEPDDDPALIASVRWTLARLADELATVAWSPPARVLLERVAALAAEIGPGASTRPAPSWRPAGASAVLAEGLQAMGWVAEERGLGGARVLDGLAWDLPVADVWEAWTAAFARDLARRVGLVATPFGGVAHELRWSGPVRSMGSLRPDVELRGAGRVVLMDAKYKRHLERLERKSWPGLTVETQAAHRADLHQALAYAAITSADRVDTILVYPHAGARPAPKTLADLTAGRRRVRMILAALPFGFRGEVHRESTLAAWRDLLAG